MFLLNPHYHVWWLILTLHTSDIKSGILLSASQFPPPPCGRFRSIIKHPRLLLFLYSTPPAASLAAPISLYLPFRFNSIFRSFIIARIAYHTPLFQLFQINFNADRYSSDLYNLSISSRSPMICASLFEIFPENIFPHWVGDLKHVFPPHYRIFDSTHFVFSSTVF